MVFWVMIQLLCMNCCWITPVWARAHLKLHRSFYRQGLQKGPSVLLPCIYSFTVSICCILCHAWSNCAYISYTWCFHPLPQHFVVVKFYLFIWSCCIGGACLKLHLCDALLIRWLLGRLRLPHKWTCSSIVSNCQTPSHSSNFPKLLSYPGHRLGSTINGNFPMLENSSKCFSLPVTLDLVLTKFSSVH